MMGEKRFNMTFEDAARPFDLAGSTDVGLLVIHGFTSTPGSMIGVAEGLHKAGGWTAVGPLLPAHGTVWTDLNTVSWKDWEATVEAAYQSLAKRTKKVVVIGLSLGGALALNLATQHPEIAGVIAVNHLIFFGDFRVPLAPILRKLLAGVPAIAGDIKAPGVTEPAYTMTPTGGVDECRKLVKQLKPKIPSLGMPMLIFKSKEDHVVPLKSATWTLDTVASTKKELIWLEDSYHVATMDSDLGRIVEESSRFIRSL
jgi:carboxylesterase